jgi:glycosyltransferase involved in cell wall biosynthesis
MHPVRSGWGALAGAVQRPLLLTVHELDARTTGAYHLPPPAEAAYKRWFNRSVFLHRSVRGWMVHSAELQEILIGLGAPPGKVTYRPMPVEIPSGPAPDPEALRAELGLTGKRPLVILGFLSRRKGYDVALAALRELPPEYVLIAAGGEHAADHSGTEAWLRAEAARAGVGDRLRITGYLSESALDHVTRSAEAVLAPFHEMSGSASLSYALARGKAVVASDLRENRALGCVRLIPPGEPGALRAAIREVTGEPAQRRSLEAAALRYAAANSYRALAEETRGQYDQLLEQDGR